MPTYTVVAGDSWERIAGKVYGNQRMYAVLREANNAIRLRPGMTISLPDEQRDPYVSPGLQAAKQAGTTGLQGISQFEADTLGRVTSPATDLARLLAEPATTRARFDTEGFPAPGYATGRARFDTEAPPDVRRAQERARLTQALGLQPTTAAAQAAQLSQQYAAAREAGTRPTAYGPGPGGTYEALESAPGIGATALQLGILTRGAIEGFLGTYRQWRQALDVARVETAGMTVAEKAQYFAEHPSLNTVGLRPTARRLTSESLAQQLQEIEPGTGQPMDVGRYGQWVIRGSEGAVYSGQSPQARLADAARYTGQGVSAYLDAVATGVNPWTGEKVSEDVARQWLPTVMSGPMMSTMMGLKSTNPWGITDTVQYAYAMGYDWDPTAWGGGAFIIAGPRRSAPIVPSGSRQARAGGGGGGRAPDGGGRGISPWNWSIRIT